MPAVLVEPISNTPLTQPTTQSTNYHPTPSKVSYADFLEMLPVEGMIAEWKDGEVILMPVNFMHNDLGVFLMRLFDIFITHHNLGKLFYEPFLLKTGNDMPARMPDFMFVANENLGIREKAHLSGSPDLIVEIVSPESVGRDYGEKFGEYEQIGVKEYWIIDPLRKKSYFYVLAEDGYFDQRLPDSEGVYHSKVLEGFWININWLWQETFPKHVEIQKMWKIS